MKPVYGWLRLLGDMCLLILMLLCGWHHELSVYLLRQGAGQAAFLVNTEPVAAFGKRALLSEAEKDNLHLISRVKAYSVDSLGYKPTRSYTRVYDQKGRPVLWVITACAPYSFRPYEWEFPLVGRVSYKGFFRKDLALREYNRLRVAGYDADLRSVSAWSTLGWFPDPVLSGMLTRSRGSLCNLMFHELFHATYYAPSSVDFNENIASFIAHQATQRFLQRDTAALREYLENHSDQKIFNAYMLRNIDGLKRYYTRIAHRSDRARLKAGFIAAIADSIEYLPLKKRSRFESRKKEMLSSGNAFFVDFIQYDSMQDSLENVFNKIYKGRVEKMVQDLKLR
jgi:predicted aminopeptidase